MMHLRIHYPKRSRIGVDATRGFSLIEMAVVLFVITLLIGSLLVPLATQVEQRQVSETEKALEEIREALLGFAVANGYLPCPDKTTNAGAGTANDGVEDVTGGACVSAEGNIPWSTLGVNATDPWGNRFRYRVVAAYAQRSPTALALGTAADLRVCTNSGCGVTSTLTQASPNGAAAVIMSHGKNGYGATNSNTGVQNPCPVSGCSVDEQSNFNATTTFISRPATTTGTTAGEFDDIVTWVSRHVLFNRMVAAGRLP